MKAKVNRVTIQLVQDDLFALPMAAVVNDTNTDLTLHPRLLERTGLSVKRELVNIGYCDVGSAVITSAGDLPAQHIIHVVGPRWGEGSERGKLANAVFECLRLTEAHRLKSIAFPAIAVGANGYPLENCAKTMLTQIIDYTFEDLRHLRTIMLCLNDRIALDAFRHEFQQQLDALQQDGAAKVKV